MRKPHLFICLILLFIVAISCKKLATNLGEGVNPISIQFVKADSTQLKASDCVDPQLGYAIEINVTISGDRINKENIIKYYFNDSSRQIIFTESGKKYIPIVFKTGLNATSINATNFKSEVQVFSQEFEIVN